MSNVKGDQAMSQKVVQNDFEVNISVVRTLLVLLKSKQGKEIFQKTIRDIGSDLTNRIQTFYEKIKLEPFLQESEKPKIQKSINELTSMLNAFPVDHINQIIRDVEEKYSVGEIVLLEGYALAVFEFLKEKFHYYYELIKLQQRFMMKIAITETISSEIPKEVIGSSEALRKLFPHGKGFQDVDTSLPLEQQVELVKNNGEIIKANLQFGENDTSLNLDFYKMLITYNPNDKSSQKQFDKFKKKIDMSFKGTEYNIDEQSKLLDESLIDLVERSIYNLIDYRKEVIKKDLRKSLPTLLSGGGGFSLF